VIVEVLFVHFALHSGLVRPTILGQRWTAHDMSCTRLCTSQMQRRGSLPVPRITEANYEAPAWMSHDVRSTRRHVWDENSRNVRRRALRGADPDAVLDDWGRVVLRDRTNRPKPAYSRQIAAQRPYFGIAGLRGAENEAPARTAATMVVR
jgi:hypothetical protein